MEEAEKLCNEDRQNEVERKKEYKLFFWLPLFTCGAFYIFFMVKMTYSFGCVNASTNISPATIGDILPPVVYGHIHIAKTAGTSLNGELAVHYERICGHKGYSFDYFHHNLRLKNATRGQWKRGKVDPKEMEEIGFEDCDWISQESIWTFWEQFENWFVPMELHVPCRDPVDHLMSQCNFRGINFECDRDPVESVQKCTVAMQRFSLKLETEYKNITLKCFDDSYTFSKYIKYMDERLQKRRIQSSYVFRSTNKPRKKEQECIWNNTGLQEEVKAHLINSHDYYEYCNRCIGSENDLFGIKLNT